MPAGASSRPAVALTGSSCSPPSSVRVGTPRRHYTGRPRASRPDASLGAARGAPWLESRSREWDAVRAPRASTCKCGRRARGGAEPPRGQRAPRRAQPIGRTPTTGRERAPRPRAGGRARGRRREHACTARVCVCERAALRSLRARPGGEGRIFGSGRELMRAEVPLFWRWFRAQSRG